MTNTTRMNLLPEELRLARHRRALLRAVLLSGILTSFAVFGANRYVGAYAKELRHEEERRIQARMATEIGRLELERAESRKRLELLAAMDEERGRIPGFLAWLGTLPWDHGRLTTLSWSAGGQGVLALEGLSTSPTFLAELAARCSVLDGIKRVVPGRVQEEDQGGRKLVRFEFVAEGTP